MSQETVRAAQQVASAKTTSFEAELSHDTLNEECGIFGVWAPDRDVARLTYFGLRALQHRGQESAVSPWATAARSWCARTWAW